MQYINGADYFKALSVPPRADIVYSTYRCLLRRRFGRFSYSGRIYQIGSLVKPCTRQFSFHDRTSATILFGIKNIWRFAHGVITCRTGKVCVEKKLNLSAWQPRLNVDSVYGLDGLAQIRVSAFAVLTKLWKRGKRRVKPHATLNVENESVKS